MADNIDIHKLDGQTEEFVLNFLHSIGLGLSKKLNPPIESFFIDDGTFKSIAEIHKIAANREWDAIRNSIDSDVYPVDGIYFKSVNPFFSVNMDKINDSGLFYVQHNNGDLYYTIKRKTHV
jgi:hypothetical protein